MYIAQALREGMSIEDIHNLSFIDKWFLDQIDELITVEEKLRNQELDLSSDNLHNIKALGFSDRRIAKILSTKEKSIRDLRKREKY